MRVGLHYRFGQEAAYNWGPGPEPRRLLRQHPSLSASGTVLLFPVCITRYMYIIAEQTPAALYHKALNNADLRAFIPLIVRGAGSLLSRQGPNGQCPQGFFAPFVRLRRASLACKCVQPLLLLLAAAAATKTFCAEVQYPLPPECSIIKKKKEKKLLPESGNFCLPNWRR